MQVTVQDVMTRGPAAVRAETTIEEVLNTLVADGLASVYVTTPENRLAGVVTDYEVLKHQVIGGDRMQTIATLMSRTVETVRPEESALAVCPQFRDCRLARMAVVDDDGRLIGNLSRRDIMRMMAAKEQIEQSTPGSNRPANEHRESTGAVPAPRGGPGARKAPPARCVP